MTNEQEAMTRSKRLTPLSLTLCLCFVLWIPRESVSAQSTLHGLRAGKHHGFSRVVLDLEGARPVHVGMASESEFIVRFTALETSIQPDRLAPRFPADLLKVSFDTNDQGLEIRIVLRSKATRQNHFFLQGRGVRYRLVVDFHSSGIAAPAEPSTESPVPFPPEPDSKKKEKPNKRERKSKEAVQSASPSGALPAEEAASGAPDASDEVYQAAHSLFESYPDQLREHAGQIIDQYKAALKAGPGSPHVPQALFRLGLSYFAVGDYKRGEECFRKILATYPRHPLTPLCWMHMGRAHEQRKSPLEAIQALRTALTFPLEKSDLVETYYALCSALAQIDAYTEVLETLGKCLELEPLAYRVRPEILRLAGESYFATQQYAKASEHLLWYLNLGNSTAHRDMILAKLGESLLHQKEPVLAKRVFSYIERHYPETEGNVISKIRRAEQLEKRSGGSKDTARFIYQELADKGLTGPLSEYVMFRLASWEKDHASYDKSLELIDQALKANLSATSREEFLSLRSRVVVEAMKQAIENKDHSRVIALYNGSPTLFQNPEKGDMLEAVADSCMALKLYPNGLELYKQAQSQGRKDDGLTFKIARCHFLMGEWERSAQQLQLIQSENLASQKANLLGQIAFSQSQYKEAIQHFARVLGREEDIERADLDTVVAYAECLIQTGKLSEALDLLGKSARCSGAGEVMSRLRIGMLQSRCFLALKQPDKAIGTLEELLTIDPPEPLRDQLRYRLSELYLENRQSDKAKEALSQLTSSSQGLWKAAAQQQLDYLEMQSKGQVKSN